MKVAILCCFCKLFLYKRFSKSLKNLRCNSAKEPEENPSKHLLISTEPMSVSSCSNNKSEDKSHCSSYASLNGSLDSGELTLMRQGFWMLLDGAGG